MGDEEFNKAIIKQRYNYYLSKKVNNSESANKILERIKDGYEPNAADIFELCCDDQKKIDEYREMFDVEQRVKNGKISEADYDFLIEKVGINDEYLESLLRQMFISTGKMVEDNNEVKHKK